MHSNNLLSHQAMWVSGYHVIATMFLNSVTAEPNNSALEYEIETKYMQPDEGLDFSVQPINNDGNETSTKEKCF